MVQNSFQFGSWTYDGTKIDLLPDEKGFDTSEYITNGEWSLVGEFKFKKHRKR